MTGGEFSMEGTTMLGALARSPKRATLEDDTNLLRDVLLTATRERALRQDFVDGELGWVLHERHVMLEQTNKIRAAHSLEPVGLDDIARAEQSAVGHSDYVTKFSFYCAELGWGRR